MKKVKVLLTEKIEIFREGLAKVLESESHIDVVATCSTGVETIQKAIKFKPDIILLDDEITQCNYIEVTHRVKEALPEAHIIILTQPDKEPDLPSIFKAEATAYITKNVKVEMLFNIIQDVYNGEVCLAPQIAAKLLEEFSLLEKSRDTGTWKDDIGLSKREVEVLALLAKTSATNKEIADTLFLSENTVKAHLSGILGKMQVRNRRQAAALAREKGLKDRRDN